MVIKEFPSLFVRRIECAWKCHEVSACHSFAYNQVYIIRVIQKFVRTNFRRQVTASCISSTMGTGGLMTPVITYIQHPPTTFTSDSNFDRDCVFQIKNLFICSLFLYKSQLILARKKQ